MSNTKTAHLVWQGERLNFSARLGSGYQINFMNPAGEEGASPMEIMLASVAGCTAMDVADMLRKMRQPVRGIELEISGLRADEHPKVYTYVDLIYVIQGEGIDSKSVERAIELSQTRYCSASIIFKRAGVEVQTSYRIEP